MKTKVLKKAKTLAVVGMIALTLIGCSTTTSKDTITVGTEAGFPPFEYMEGDKIIGFDIDIAQKIADKLGKTLVIEDMEFKSLINAVNTGKIDFIAAAMTITEEKAEQVDFSQPYFQSKQVMIVREDTNDIITSEDLVGRKIGVQLGTTGDLFASDIEEATVEQFDKVALAVMDLANGKIDVVIVDEEPAKNILNNQSGLKIVEAPFIEESYGIVVKKGNTELKDAINEVLEEMKNDGTYEELYTKYFGTVD
jgi:polar amino acid transport system substrate-binding protein